MDHLSYRVLAERIRVIVLLVVVAGLPGCLAHIEPPAGTGQSPSASGMSFQVTDDGELQVSRDDGVPVAMEDFRAAQRADQHGMTQLHRRAFAGDAERVRQLLNAGARVDAHADLKVAGTLSRRRRKLPCAANA